MSLDHGIEGVAKVSQGDFEPIAAAQVKELEKPLGLCHRLGITLHLDPVVAGHGAHLEGFIDQLEVRFLADEKVARWRGF